MLNAKSALNTAWSILKSWTIMHTFLSVILPGRILVTGTSKQMHIITACAKLESGKNDNILSGFVKIFKRVRVCSNIYWWEMQTSFGSSLVPWVCNIKATFSFGFAIFVAWKSGSGLFLKKFSKDFASEAPLPKITTWQLSVRRCSDKTRSICPDVRKSQKTNFGLMPAKKARHSWWLTSYSIGATMQPANRMPRTAAVWSACGLLQITIISVLVRFFASNSVAIWIARDRTEPFVSVIPEVASTCKEFSIQINFKLIEVHYSKK